MKLSPVKDHVDHGTIYIANKAYQSAGLDELDLLEGDIIISDDIVSSANEGYYKGTHMTGNNKGKTGFFPLSHVTRETIDRKAEEIASPISVTVQELEGEPETKISTPNTPSSVGSIMEMDFDVDNFDMDNNYTEKANQDQKLQEEYNKLQIMRRQSR